MIWRETAIARLPHFVSRVSSSRDVGATRLRGSKASDARMERVARTDEEAATMSDSVRRPTAIDEEPTLLQREVHFQKPLSE